MGFNFFKRSDKTKTNKLVVNKLYFILFVALLSFFLFQSITNTKKAVISFKNDSPSELIRDNNLYERIDQVESFFDIEQLYSDFQLDSMLIHEQERLPNLIKQDKAQDVLLTLLRIKNIQLSIIKRKTL
jgi:hypothetical protein